MMCLFFKFGQILKFLHLLIARSPKNPMETLATPDGRRQFQGDTQSASAQRYLRPFGTTMDIATLNLTSSTCDIVPMRAVLWHSCLRKARWDTGVVTRIYRPPGIADESAGKQRSGKTRKGNQVLRAGLTQLAHGAVRTKGTYVSALYRRLAARRGKRRAILAVAHSIMGSVFHMLSRNEPYRELGPNYFDERRRHYTVDRLTSRIENLGYRVHLELSPVT